VEIPAYTFYYFVIETTARLNKLDTHIWQYIGHYLHKHNELCLMGMGRFATQMNEFSVDPVSKKIIPAFKKVYFQVGDFETSPEFLLFLAAILDQTENAIVDNIALTLADFNETILLNQKHQIDGFGSFKYNIMAELVFESSTEISYNDNTFGLKPVHFAANLLKTKRLVLEKIEEEDQELTEMRESSLKELKVLLDNARIAESTKPKKNTKLFPIVATILTLILLINLGFFLFKGPVSQIKQQISQMSFLGNTAQIIDSQIAETATIKIIEPVKPIVEPVASKETTISFDSIANHIGLAFTKGAFDFDSNYYTPTVVVIPEPRATPASVPMLAEPTAVSAEVTKSPEIAEEIVTDMPNMVSVDATENGIEKGFYVVLGAFKNEKNAIRLKDKLIKNGNLSAVVIKPASHPCYLVSYQKNTTLNQALNQLEQKQDKHPAIWVYCAY